MMTYDNATSYQPQPFENLRSQHLLISLRLPCPTTAPKGSSDRLRRQRSSDTRLGKPSLSSSRGIRTWRSDHVPDPVKPAFEASHLLGAVRINGQAERRLHQRSRPSSVSIL
ncbi:hypothetical protein BHE90_006982 [Fusarium euwallaceae]|uniref:Uncharacterized protein n=1 Tax=Fusarium euwallaceae TaxID=1147111 RepID=A0A430LS58_9HYPO|nr:hypothetical protein BHE90_006982 [Fusarium euwallaceae]